MILHLIVHTTVIYPSLKSFVGNFYLDVMSQQKLLLMTYGKYVLMVIVPLLSMDLQILQVILLLIL